MTAAIRKVLEDHATGMGVSFSKVRKHYESLGEADRFAFIRGARELEMAHREFMKDPDGFKATQTPVLFGANEEEL
jgi:hypothetical protein